MRKLKAIISKGPEDYGAWIENLPGAYGAGETVAQVKKSLKEGLKLYVKYNGVADWLKNKDYELVYQYDSQSS